MNNRIYSRIVLLDSLYGDLRFEYMIISITFYLNNHKMYCAVYLKRQKTIHSEMQFYLEETGIILLNSKHLTKFLKVMFRLIAIN